MKLNPSQSPSLYQQKQLPTLQNRVYDSREEALSCKTGDIDLVQDGVTGLVCNAAFRPELLNYDERYQNEQAISPYFQAHLREVAGIIERRLGKTALVEVGCGKGTFLELALSAGLDITGFDPAYEGTNPRISKSHFEPNLGMSANGLILRHVLEHIHNPYIFLEQLKAANESKGFIYVEVPCFEWICKHRAWFDVFYEHVNYFRIADFYAMFGNVVEAGHLFGGQYLYVIAELASLREPKFDNRQPIKFPIDFAQNILSLSEPNTGSTAIWGASSKGVVFSILKMRAGHSIDTVIDINPAKQGKYLPLSGLLVQSPETALSVIAPGTTIYVMNSNYLAEIKEMSGNAFRYITIEHG